jgi:NADH-quinone oxidoreductase subunit L
MEGPTPVSALIHAATMVTAGVFIVARAHPYFEVSGDAMTVVAVVGAGTALLAATVAMVQPDIKRVLAYSTISQLGFMFLALGVGAYGAAIFHVVTHAFFKGTLFLGAGSVIHGNGDNQDMRVMGGFRKYMPLTAIAMIIGWLSIAGVPPFSGFWSKDEILTKAFLGHDYGVWAIGLLAALLTGFYMTRLVYLVFFGNERAAARGSAAPVTAAGVTAAGASPAATSAAMAVEPTPTVAFGEAPRPSRVDARHPPHESPRVMTVPLLVLAGFAAVGGLLNVPLHGLEFLVEWLHPVFHDVPEIHAPSFVDGVALSAASVLVGLVGLGLATKLYRGGLASPDGDPALDRLGRLGQIFGNAYSFDDGIARLVRGPLRRGADWCSDVLDARIVDGAVNGTGALVRRTASGLRRVQTGFVRSYALWIAIGTAGVLLFLLLYSGR